MCVSVYVSVYLCACECVCMCVCVCEKERHSRAPAQVLGVDVENAGTGHGGRSSSPQVGDLKQQTHGGGEADALVTGQGQIGRASCRERV